MQSVSEIRCCDNSNVDHRIPQLAFLKTKKMSFDDLPQEIRDLLFSFWSPSKEISQKWLFHELLWHDDIDKVYELLPDWYHQYDKQATINFLILFGRDADDTD